MSPWRSAFVSCRMLMPHLVAPGPPERVGRNRNLCLTTLDLESSVMIGGEVAVSKDGMSGSIVKDRTTAAARTVPNSSPWARWGRRPANNTFRLRLLRTGQARHPPPPGRLGGGCCRPATKRSRNDLRGGSPGRRVRRARLPCGAFAALTHARARHTVPGFPVPSMRNGSQQDRNSRPRQWVAPSVRQMLT